MNQNLDYIAILAILIFLIKAIQDLEKGLLLGLLIKPLIDTGWDFKIGPMSLIDIHAIFFLWFGFQLVFKRNLFKRMSSTLILTWFIAHLGLLFLFLKSPENGFEGLIKVLFLPLALVLFPYFWSHRSFNKILIKYLLIGSLFPVIIILLQSSGILSMETIRMTKGLTRINGYYHDIVTSRIYIVQGLFSLFIIYKTQLIDLSRFKILGLLMFFLTGGFFLYSKAFVGIIIMGVILFLLTNRNKSALLGAILLLISVYTLFMDEVSPAIEQMFVKEIEYNQGQNANTDQLFSGRGMLWTDYLNEFNESDTFTQFLGLHRNASRTHNEFLRILILSGLIGIFMYMIFTLKLINSALKTILKKNQLSFIALWSMGILLLDSFSVVWGLFPYYLIMILGFLFIAIQNTDDQIIVKEI